MPKLSEFYGIVIEMYWNDHNPPHFHAIYAGRNASIGIDSLEILGGSIPPRARRLVQKWASLHQVELLRCWHQVRNRRSPRSVEPLP